MKHARIARRAAVASAACAGCMYATTLVAIWTPHRLLIGADSAVITGVAGQHGTACKIAQDGPAVFAFAGLVEDRATAYNAAAIARSAIERGGTLEERLNRFIEHARAPLERALAGLKTDSPAQYAYLEADHPVLQAIFAGEEAGPPVLGVASFSLDASGQLQPYVRMVANGDDGRGTRIIYAGQQRQVREYLKTHPEWSQSDPAQLIRTLIQHEIDAAAGEVAGPIDIIQIEPNAAAWVQKKPGCGGNLAAGLRTISEKPLSGGTY